MNEEAYKDFKHSIWGASHSAEMDAYIDGWEAAEEGEGPDPPPYKHKKLTAAWIKGYNGGLLHKKTLDLS